MDDSGHPLPILPSAKLSPSETVLIVAGEVSGDLHAAPVVAAMRRLSPDLRFVGAGGDGLRNEGVELLADVRDLAMMGFSGVPKILPRLWRLKADILDRVRAENIRLAILVDYPGFNLNLARALKSLPDPPRVLNYIAPQLWAWRPGRAEIIRRYVDRLAVVFAFEVEFFRKYGIEPVFVGHPLLDELADYIGREKVHKCESAKVRPISTYALTHFRTYALSPLLALLPGSRPSVAARHLPLMIEAADILRRDHPTLKIAVGRAPAITGPLASGLSPAPHAGWQLSESLAGREIEVWDDSRELLRQATVAAVCSGTATLEAALFGTPQVVVYRTSFLNYRVAKAFVQIPRVSLVNVTAGREVVPELIQREFTPQRLAEELDLLLSDSLRRQRVIEGYADVKGALGQPGGAERVAELAIRIKCVSA